jgi:hypothetical protein
MRRLAGLLCLGSALMAGLAGPARAEDAAPCDAACRAVEDLNARVEALEETAAEAHGPASPEAPRLSASGYAELLFSYYDYGPDPTLPGGSAPDHRYVFDTSRLSVEMEVNYGHGLELEGEVEFEHGGTGSALELDYDEFGEFEQEVEKGGEVVLEELYVEKRFGPRLAVKAGRFYVALGLLSDYHRPTDYLGTTRPESETTVIPAVWDEMGFEARVSVAGLRLTGQLVSGLDSSAFGSQNWVASGHQARFEEVRADGLAAVGRVDVMWFPGWVFGGSVYYGFDTNANRPKPDLDDVDSPLLIGSVHLAADRGPLRLRGAALWGRLGNSEAISERNRRLSNDLGVPRTPVAQDAIAEWAEAGVDLAALTGHKGRHRVEPYVRVEHYDTMYATAGNVFDNPRFERTLVAVGVGHTWARRVTTKLDWSHRTFGNSALRAEDTVRLAFGAVF